jgi:Flp pilus assembly protein TadG
MLLGRFLQDRRAAVAPILGLLIFPMVGAVGAAVDYSRAAAVRTAMQTAIDSTALMLSKTAQNLTPAQINTSANNYFTALFNRPEASNVQIATQFSSQQQGSFTLAVTGTADVSTMFWRLMGQDMVHLTTTGEVIWGIKKLNLALALDNTGSMAQSSKMTQLKIAAHSLLTTLQNAATTPGDITVSIVPFATDVNVGTANVDATWIDWTDWNAANGTCSSTSYTTQSTCTSHSKIWTPANHSTWNGCVYDRDQNNDVLNTAPVAGSADHVPGPPSCELPGVHDDAVLRLDRTQQQDRCDDARRQHQCHHRDADGVADAVAGGAIQRARRLARPRKGPHSLDRRHQHAEPLVLERLGDRRAHAESVRQCQDRQHQGLHGPRHRRQRVAAARLRNQPEHVFQRPAGKSAQQRLQLDRAKPRQSSHLEVTVACVLGVPPVTTRCEPSSGIRVAPRAHVIADHVIAAHVIAFDQWMPRTHRTTLPSRWKS